MRQRWRDIVFLCVAIVIVSAGVDALAAPEKNLSALAEEAERYYQEGSYRRSYDLYQQIFAAHPDSEMLQWTRFRLADTLWRQNAAAASPDATILEDARRQLEELAAEYTEPAARNTLWADVVESLADSFWLFRGAQDWGAAWPRYQEVLTWWGNSSDIEKARRRYLDIVWRISEPPYREEYYPYAYFVGQVPEEIIENAVKIAVSPQDKARAHYLTAIRFMQDSNPLQAKRVRAAFVAAVNAGQGTPWHDDALFYYAQWCTRSGILKRDDAGTLSSAPDFKTAVAVCKQMLRDFQKGKTRYFEQAQSLLKTLTDPELTVSVSEIFAPGAAASFYCQWRNVSRIDFALYPVNMPEAADFSRTSAPADQWLQSIKISGSPLRRWGKDGTPQQEYAPGEEVITVPGKLAAGAYVLVATAAGKEARELILVSEAAVVLRSSGRKALVFLTHAFTGNPVVNAPVVIWERVHERNNSWRRQRGVTDNDGLCLFSLPESRNSRDIFVAAGSAGMQAFCTGYGSAEPAAGERWRVYAITDRPVYRPEDTVQWKIIARQKNGQDYTVPAATIVEYEISDAQGAAVASGTATLNQFGGAWGTLPLTKAMVLGDYRLAVWTAGKNIRIAQAPLFRLEEYKLPEFSVAVNIPRDESGAQRRFSLGQTVSAEISAQYYFGGPVAAAAVEVLVYQKPFWPQWDKSREYPWLFRDTAGMRQSYGPGQIVKREALTTDAQGRAQVSFPTPASMHQEWEYRIEARVTDSSRREIIGENTVRVTRQSYYARVEPAHQLYRPRENVTIAVATRDANQQAVAAAGTVTVTRQWWEESWIDSQGAALTPEQVRGACAAYGGCEADGRLDSEICRPQGCRLVAQGYRQEAIASRALATAADGTAELTFIPEKEGYYRIAWLSAAEDMVPVTAQATIWVTTKKTRQLGYYPAGLELIVDQDTWQAGTTAPVLVVTPYPAQAVLVSFAADELLDYQLVRLEETSGMLEIDVPAAYAPNVFLEAAAVRGGELFSAQQEIIVPPRERFLNLQIQSEKPEYLPGEQGRFSVTVTDDDGEPVAAELSLAVCDDAVHAIQQSYAQDIRQFFYGQKRRNAVALASSFSVRNFQRPASSMNRFGDEKIGRGEEHRFKKDAGLNLREQKSLSVVQESAVADCTEPAAAFKPSESDAAGNVRVRHDFRATALWVPEFHTDAQGQAFAELIFPDSLTRWQAAVTAVSRDSRVGAAGTACRTKQPLIVQLQAPRFFVCGDETVVCAVIYNNTESELKVTAALRADGLNVVTAGAEKTAREQVTSVPAQSQKRVDWPVRAAHPGTATIRVSARATAYADAMEKSMAVYAHGIEQVFARSGKISGGEARVNFRLPRERVMAAPGIELAVTPSVAVTMLDALPYLIDYPYGCTEQTMSRFLPAAVVQKTLRSLGLNAADIEGKMFGGIERAFAAATQTPGQKPLAYLPDMTEQGLKRLYDFQHADGGWGWWKEGDSDRWMSAYVLWGLSLAADAGCAVDAGVVERAATYMARQLIEAEQMPDVQAWMLHALAVYRRGTPKSARTAFEQQAFDNLWQQRDRLNAFTRALAALSAHAYGFNEQAALLARNLENDAIWDRQPEPSCRGAAAEEEPDKERMATAYWGIGGEIERWSDDDVETTAFCLRALLTILPEHPLVEPAVQWLVRNRRGNQWSNTRDTAITVLCLSEYLRKQSRAEGDVAYEIIVNGRSIAKQSCTPQDMLRIPSRFTVPPELVRDGETEIRFVRADGTMPLYYSVQAKYFTGEEPVPAAGNELFVRRQYVRLAGRPTLLQGQAYERVVLPDNARVQSGERVEVVVTIEAKNNYEYLIIEDLKPAGLETVQLRSGQPLFAYQIKSGAFERLAAGGLAAPADQIGQPRYVYQELRDRAVVFFIDKLPQGVWQLCYELRAETPGNFHALPVLCQAMYVPEIRANSAESRVRVEAGK
ncbi:MAG: MG2 domain-containing protein [Candidatus Omnitrophica bacterium]|nr:MG2 domain-containing protein [Candidatus Omnitrophota bacterium]